MVRPILEYASCVWSPHLKQDQNQLERVQRRATRLIPSLRRLPYSERLKALDLPTLAFRRTRYDLIQTFKLIKGIDTMSQDTGCTSCTHSTMFQPSLSRHTRGHSQKLQVQQATGPRKRFFSTRVTPLWNKLSETTVNAGTVNHFKTGLKRDLAHMDPYAYQF